jgi:hypothetical protein
VDKVTIPGGFFDVCFWVRIQPSIPRISHARIV